MTKMKKLLALCLSMMIIISALPLTVGAEDTPEEVIKFTAGYKHGNGTLLDGYADINYYVTKEGKPTTVGDIGNDYNRHFVLANNTQSMVVNYDITTQYTGIYKLDAQVGFDPNGTSAASDLLHIYVNGEEIGTYEANDGGYCKYNGIKELAYIYANAGEKFTLSFNNPNTTGAKSKTYITMQVVNLTLQPDPALEGASIKEGDTVNKSTDVITLDYTLGIKAKALESATVELKNSKEETLVSTLAVNSEDNTKLDIILGESLEYGETYTLTFANIPTVAGYVFEGEETISFSVPAKEEDESAKKDTLVIDSLEIENTTFTLKGTVTGSKGQAIKGREVNTSFVFPKSQETKNLDAEKTDENGQFTVIYTLEGAEADESGLYEFTAETEFAEEAKFDSEIYVSSAEIDRLLATLEDLTEDIQVETFFTDNDCENAVILGVDLTDLDKFSDNKNLFYKRLADATYSDNGVYELDIFIKVWEDAYSLEDINLSDDNEVTLGYLDNADFREKAGIKEAEYVLLDEQKDAFVTEVTAFERAETMEAFGKAVNALFNDFLKKEFSKTDLTLTLDTTNATVYVGQSAYIEVATAKTTDVKSYTLKVTCPTDTSAEKIEFTSDNGKASKSVDGKEALFTVTDVEGELEVLGKIAYSSSSATSQEIKVEGSVVYEVQEVEVYGSINNKKAEINIKENSGKSYSASSSSFTSGGSTVKPVVDPNAEKEGDKKDQTFTDISGIAWAQESIDYLYKKGIISEAADGKFRPNDSVTRAEFVKMLVSALRITDKKAQVKLSDVSQSDWYYEYVSAAVSYGLVLGDEKGNFRPNDKITRQDICVIISRAMDKLGYGKAEEGQLFYDDAHISAYAKDAVYRMRAHGIVNGTGDGGFAPLSDATRAATAKIIYAFMKEAKI